MIRRYGEGGWRGGDRARLLGQHVGRDGPRADGASARTKYQEATAALREVLAKVGRGTTVSLWVFGEELGPNDTADQAERPFFRVLPPTPWRPDDPALLADVMGRVESPRLIPWNESPIVRAMLLARDDLREASGFKTLLVLTDGKDNRFEKDVEINRAKKDIPTAIRDAFSASDIEINMVGYKVKDAEEVEAMKQFQVIEELPRAGRFFSVKEARLLASTMSQALRPSLQCSLETIGNELVESLTVSRPTDNDRWSEPGLTPGGYKLVTQAGGRVRATSRSTGATCCSCGSPTMEGSASTAASSPAIPRRGRTT